MSSNKWQLGLLDSRRFVSGHWFTANRSIAHDAFFAPTASTSTFTYTTSAHFAGFVGSADLSRSQVLNSYTYASTAEFAGFVGSAGTSFPPLQYTATTSPEFAGFVGSAGLTFDPLELTYTYASTAEFAGFVGSAFTEYVAGASDTFSIFTYAGSAEFAGFVGSADLVFDPFERTYTYASTAEFAGFVGSADPSQSPNFAYTATTSPEFAGFVGSAAPSITGPAFAYTYATSPEFAGFAGGAATAYVAGIALETGGERRSGGGLIVPGRRRGIIDIISPLPPVANEPPRVYNAVVGLDGGFGGKGGSADVSFTRQKQSLVQMAMAGVFH